MKDIKDILIKLSEEVAEYLGIDLIPIEYENLEIDDSRLILKPISKIVINIKYENNFLESAKCITHEMRHIFQIYWANLMDDKFARIWKEELAQAKSSANINVNSNEYNDYSLQAIELDVFAFSQYYLRNRNIYFKYEDKRFQRLVEEYMKKYLYEN
ncbi:MAG: hypothetical protein J6K18_00140 [Bacilli bacterium]|nr:hypothetical protein [Bacilli bacterium]